MIYPDVRHEQDFDLIVLKKCQTIFKQRKRAKRVRQISPFFRFAKSRRTQSHFTT